MSGQTNAAYMNTTFFKPLKMKISSFTICNKIIKNSAKAYDEKANEILLRLFNAKAAAGLPTTLEDLMIFTFVSFSDNPVLTQKSIQQLIEPTNLSKRN